MGRAPGPGLTRVGLISDTHGMLRPQALEALQASDHIVHAGDLVQPAILSALANIAPVTAVRGNNDKGAWAESLSQVEILRLGEVRIVVVHDVKDLPFDPADIGIAVVVSGHSHRPLVERRGDVLYVNPGSAGPRRFKLPVSVAELRVDGLQVDARIVMLDV
jgi:putative phosphoesterase